MKWTLECADALEFLRRQPDESVHCTITSPPYYALRDYSCAGQIGLESTPQEYLDLLLAVFEEVRRVTHDAGSCWVNIADTYGGSGKGGGGGGSITGNYESPEVLAQSKKKTGMPLSLMGIPERFALGMVERGWLWRDRIALFKPSPMPESLTGWAWRKHRIKVKGHQRSVGYSNSTAGRPQSDSRHEGPYEHAKFVDCPGCRKCEKNDGLILSKGSWRTTRAWEYLFVFAKTPNYYADGEAVRTSVAEATIEREMYSRILDDPDEAYAVRHDHETISAGANLRSWWRWQAEPSNLPHYAALPVWLPDRVIRCATSEKGYCGECGEPVCRVLDKPSVGAWHEHKENITHGGRQNGRGPANEYESAKTTGWSPSCCCSGDLSPGVVLDPFAGTGTTAVAALRLGRRFIGCDLSEKYVALANERIVADNPL